MLIIRSIRFKKNRMSDLELLECIKKKDSKAFGILYSRYHRIFFGWVQSRTSDWDVASDLMQEFWTAVWLKPDEIQPDNEGSAKNYLKRNVTLRVLRHFHKLCNKAEITNDALASEQLESLTYSHVAEDLNVKEIHQIIDRLLQAMPIITRRIYELRYLESRSIKETAEMLSISEGTVRNGTSAALRSIRKELTLLYGISEPDKLKALLPLLIFLLDQ